MRNAKTSGPSPEEHGVVLYFKKYGADRCSEWSLGGELKCIKVKGHARDCCAVRSASSPSNDRAILHWEPGTGGRRGIEVGVPAGALARTG